MSSDPVHSIPLEVVIPQRRFRKPRRWCDPKVLFLTCHDSVKCLERLGALLLKTSVQHDKFIKLGLQQRDNFQLRCGDPAPGGIPKESLKFALAANLKRWTPVALFMLFNWFRSCMRIEISCISTQPATQCI